MEEIDKEVCYSYVSYIENKVKCMYPDYKNVSYQDVGYVYNNDLNHYLRSKNIKFNGKTAQYLKDNMEKNIEYIHDLLIKDGD